MLKTNWQIIQSANPEARMPQVPARDMPLVDHSAAIESGKRLEQAMLTLSPGSAKSLKATAMARAAAKTSPGAGSGWRM